MKRHLYSIIHFCPRPTERVNVGVVVVLDDAEITDARARITDDWSRAEAMGNKEVVVGVQRHLADFVMTEANWDLKDMHEKHNHLIQYTSPLPALGETPDDVMEQVWKEFME